MPRPRLVRTPPAPRQQALLGAADLTSKAKRQSGWVSQWSRWSDSRWYFADPAKSDHHYSAAVWDFEMLDGSSFSDPRYEELREASKIVTYCAHRFPSMRGQLKPQTVNEVSIGLRYFVRWLIGSRLGGLYSVGPAQLDAFREHLVADKLNDDLDEHLTASSIARWFRAPFLFWEERHHLQAAGIQSLPHVPFPGETNHTLANSLAKVAVGRIKPIPNDILVPLLNKAAWFIDRPAADVVQLTQFLASEVPAVLVDAEARATRGQLGRYLTRKFEFTNIDGKPWHGSLASAHKRVSAKNLQWKEESSMDLARDLIQDVMGAASMLLQGAAGLRISEIEALEASGADTNTGLPDCVELRTDDTGLIELFYLKGFLIKTTRSRQEAEWLIGARVVGATHVPLPVLAVQRLYELSAILNQTTNSRSLFPGPVQAGTWAYFAGESGSLDGKQLQALQRAFAANYVDAALLDNVELLRTHGWRKSFAQFVFGIDPTLGPALSQHFKHISIAMTMEAYVTNDAALLGYLDSERAMETARHLYEISTGRAAPAGRLGGSLARHHEQFASLINGKAEDEAINALYGYVTEHQVPFWFLEWGNCGVTLAPNEAACHSEAGTTSWRNIAPNFGFRDLDVCVGCSRLLILRRHLPFWQERYRSLRQAFDDRDEDLGPVFAAALRKRLVQAKAVVRALTPLQRSSCLASDQADPKAKEAKL